MSIEELLDEWEKIVRKGKEEIEKWVISLSNEDFNIPTKIPIIIQTKIHYKKLREENRTAQ